MAILNLTLATRSDMAQMLLDKITVGTLAATLKLYAGSMPAGPDTAIGAQTLLGTMTCSIPEATRTNNVITFAAITSDSAADATATATFARLINGDGTAVADFDVTDSAGVGYIKFNTAAIVAGGPIGITSLTITV